VVPSVLGDLDGGCALSGGDFGARRGRQRREGIDEALEGEGLGAESLALLFAVSLVGEDGEVGERESERDTASLLFDRVRNCSRFSYQSESEMRTKPVVKPMVGA
jgi:hypothetical protein